MRIPQKLKGMLAGAAFTAAVLGVMSLTAPAHATQIGDPGVYDQTRDLPRRLVLPLNLQDGRPRFDPYTQESRSRQEQDRLWAPSTQHDDMRDGGTPPWDSTRWGR